jgi:hypothetical protein
VSLAAPSLWTDRLSSSSQLHPVDLWVCARHVDSIKPARRLRTDKVYHPAEVSQHNILGSSGIHRLGNEVFISYVNSSSGRITNFRSPPRVSNGGTFGPHELPEISRDLKEKHPKRRVLLNHTDHSVGSPGLPSAHKKKKKEISTTAVAGVAVNTSSHLLKSKYGTLLFS